MRPYAILIILLATLPSISMAKVIKDLGQRTSQCTNLISDDFEWDPHPTLMLETKSLIGKNKLKQLLIPGGTCLRVGTEINITNLKDTYGLLGRALVDSIETLTAKELKRRKLAFSAKSIEAFIQSTKQSTYIIVNIEVTEKITETVLRKKYSRLKTCFPMFSDWRSFRLPDGPEGKKLASKIQAGEVVATIRNGVLNCHKVGKYTPLALPGDSVSSLGGVKVKELHLIHHTNLNERHAKLLGTELTTLKSKMKQNSAIDGGYTNLTVFEYQEPDENYDSSETTEEEN